MFFTWESSFVFTDIFFVLFDNYFCVHVQHIFIIKNNFVIDCFFKYFFIDWNLSIIVIKPSFGSWFLDLCFNISIKGFIISQSGLAMYRVNRSAPRLPIVLACFRWDLIRVAPTFILDDVYWDFLAARHSNLRVIWGGFHFLSLILV